METLGHSKVHLNKLRGRQGQDRHRPPAFYFFKNFPHCQGGSFGLPNNRIWCHQNHHHHPLFYTYNLATSPVNSPKEKGKSIARLITPGPTSIPLLHPPATSQRKSKHYRTENSKRRPYICSKR